MKWKPLVSAPLLLLALGVTTSALAQEKTAGAKTITFDTDAVGSGLWTKADSAIAFDDLTIEGR